MIFPETDHHLLTRIDEIIQTTQEKSTKEKLEDLKKLIVERIETRQKQAVMYLVSTSDLGNYVNEKVFEALLSFKKDK